MYLKSNQGFTLIVLVRRRPRCFPPYNGQLHMFDLQPHQQKVYPANNDVLEMIFRFRIFEFDMQTILDANVHLDRVV